MRFRRPPTRFVTAAIAIAAGVANAPLSGSPAYAQTDAPVDGSPPTQAAPPTIRTYLEHLHYSVEDRGPLLVVAVDDLFSDDPDGGPNAPVGQISLGGLAHAAGRKAVSVGRMTVVVPEMMKLIDGDPGKANPFTGMHPDELVKLLLGGFTPSQWQTACGPAGIGLSDLKDDQKLLFDAMLPSDFEIHKIRTTAGPSPGSVFYNESEVIPVHDRTNIRLRLNRNLFYSFGSGPTWTHSTDGGFAGDVPGETRLEMYKPDILGFPNRGVPVLNFGQTFTEIIPNRQKPGQIDYASNQFNTAVSLDGLDPKGTVGDLITRVDQATGTDIVPDRRVSDLPIYVRGSSTRAGDLLQGIALALCGTYRKIGATSTYVLTSDLEGIGARMTKLEDWSERAIAQRKNVLDEAVRKAADKNPLDYLTFPPDDPLALSPSQTAEIDDRYRKDPDLFMKAPAINSADLSPALRNEFSRAAAREESLTGGRVAVDTRKVRLEMSVSFSLIVPGVGTVVDGDLAQDAASLLRHLAATTDDSSRQAKSSAPVAPPDWTWLDAPPKRRVLLVAAGTPADAEQLIAEAARHGFTEVWIRLDATNSVEQRTILDAAIAAGKLHNVAVAADLALLQNKGVNGEPERNIEGQTGAEFAVAYAKTHPLHSASDKPGDPSEAVDVEKRLEARYANWHSVDKAILLRHVSDLATTLGLSGLVLEKTAPPGFVSPKFEYNNPALLGGELGFTDSRRAAFLHLTGLDPVDIRIAAIALVTLDMSEPYFTNLRRTTDKTVHHAGVAGDSNPSQRVFWSDFREKENLALMKSLYQTVRTLRPTLPLWIDDRIGDYAEVTPRSFVPLTDPAHLPDPDFGAPPPTVHVATPVAPKPSLLRAIVPTSTTPEGQAAFAAFIARFGARSVSENWSGVVFDFADMPTEDALPLLQALPASRVRLDGNAAHLVARASP